MNIEIRYVDKDTGDEIPLPDVQQVSLSPVLNDYGSLSFDYPKSGINWSLLKGLDEFEVTVYVNGIKYPELGAVVQEISGDDVAEASIFSYGGNMMLTVLDEGVVYPNNWPAYDPKTPNHVLPNYTAGMYLGRFIDLAQQRGALQGVTWNSFSPSADSNGQPWTKQISLTIKPGPSIASLLQSMYANGLCEFRMVGRDLRLYNPGTYTVDRTLQNPPLTFRKGRDLRDSPRKISSRGVGTVFLGAGKEDSGTYAEEVNATAVAARRRIERYASNGNITDPGTMAAFLQLQLQTSSESKMEKTSGLEFIDENSPRPLDHFDVGDWAYIEVDGVLERLRIKQWVLTKDATGKVSGSVTMNDMFAEAAENLAKRIDGILGGTTVSGESRAVDTVPGSVYDNLAPAAPNLPILNTSTYTDKNGSTVAQVTASWIQVTTNADGSALEDLAGYRLAYTVPGVGVSVNYVDMGNVTTVGFSPLPVNEDVLVKVQAYDKYGNASAWSPTATIHTGVDVIPPEKPSTPVMDNALGVVRGTWDGKSASGAAWPTDFSYVEVHTSLVNNFTPSYGVGTTLTDYLTGAGKFFAKGNYGQPVYARLVPVDTSGNKGTPSDIAFISPQQVVSSDVFDGAIGTAKLADLAVTTAKIANLAVNAAQIGSVNVGSLVAGIMTADVTVSGRFATALSGKRSEMNALGFQGWNAAGTLTLSLDGEDNLMMGTFRTAVTGRRIEIAASGSKGEVNFYGPAGQLAQMRAYTSDLGVWSSEAIEMRNPISGVSPAWNSVQVDSDEEAFVTSGLVQNTVGGNGTNPNKGFRIQWAINRGTPTSLPSQTYNRMVLDANNTVFYGPTGDSIFQILNSSGQWTRTAVRDSAGTSKGVVDILNYGSGNSPALRMLDSSLAVGGQFAFEGANGWFAFLNGNLSAYETIRVAAVNTTSDESAKKSIKKFSGARSKIQGMEAHTYTMGKDKRRRLGFMSQKAPAEIRIQPKKTDKIQHEAIDLYGLTTLGIEYAREIDSDVEALRQEVASLREEMAKR